MAGDGANMGQFIQLCKTKSSLFVLLEGGGGGGGRSTSGVLEWTFLILF